MSAPCRIPIPTAVTQPQLLGYLGVTHMTRKGLMISGVLQASTTTWP